MLARAVEECELRAWQRSLVLATVTGTAPGLAANATVAKASGNRVRGAS
jgi:hypothetical protein